MSGIADLGSSNDGSHEPPLASEQMNLATGPVFSQTATHSPQKSPQDERAINPDANMPLSGPEISAFGRGSNGYEVYEQQQREQQQSEQQQSEQQQEQQKPPATSNETPSGQSTINNLITQPIVTESESDVTSSATASPSKFQPGLKATTQSIGPTSGVMQICRWQDCNSDWSKSGFIDHVTNAHLKHNTDMTCEWDHCPRRGQPLFNLYALLGHLKTHIGERAFPCVVPECDRAFTRADSMAKHLKLTHNVDLGHPPLRKSKVLKARTLRADRIRSQIEHGSIRETLQSGNDLEKLKRQYVWAEQMSHQLEQEMQAVEQQQFDLLLEKEKIFDQILEKELGDDDAKDIYLLKAIN